MAWAWSLSRCLCWRAKAMPGALPGRRWQLRIAYGLSFVVVCWFMAVMAQVHGLMGYNAVTSSAPLGLQPQEADRSRSGQSVPSPKPEVDGHRFSRDLRFANGNFEFGNFKRMAVQCCHGQQKRQVATTFRKTLNWNLSACIWRTVFLGFGNGSSGSSGHRATPCNMGMALACNDCNGSKPLAAGKSSGEASG